MDPRVTTDRPDFSTFLMVKFRPELNSNPSPPTQATGGRELFQKTQERYLELRGGEPFIKVKAPPPSLSLSLALSRARALCLSPSLSFFLSVQGASSPVPFLSPVCRGTSLVRNTPPVGSYSEESYSSPIPRNTWWSLGVSVFLMSES